MRYRCLTVVALTLVAYVVIARHPVDAAADDAARVGLAVQKAAGAASSFRMTLDGAQSLREAITVVLPDRVKASITVGPMTTESIVVGSTSYVRINGGQWLVAKMQNAADFAQQFAATLAKSTTYTILPDRDEAGVTYGAFSATSAAPAAALASGAGTPAAGASAAPLPTTTTECSYDKATYLMHVCTLQPPEVPFPMTVTYSGWNDPANSVELPPDAPPVK